MRGLLPEQFSARPRYSDALVLRPTRTALAMFVRWRGVETPFGAAAAGGDLQRRLRAARPGPTVLRLPSSALLEQPVSLPLAAERDLAAVLRNEMDRLTPFAAEDLYWTWRLDRRDRAAGRLALHVLLVPKAAVQASLAAAEAAGLRPVALEVAAANGLQHLSLASPNAEAGASRSALIGAAVCAVLALLVCAVPLIRQELAIRAVEARIEAQRPSVALVDGLRRRLAATVSGADLFASEAARVGNPLRALAAVTSALPDDTSLTNFTLRERGIALVGRSAGATRLISLLAADPDLRDPAFDAPVTRIGNKADLFSIHVRLAP